MKRRSVGDMMAQGAVQGALCQVAPDTTVKDAIAVMAREHVGSALIMRDGRLAGIFTERDAVSRVLAQGRDPKTTPLSAVMTGKPQTIHPRATALEALRVLRDGGFRHLPVVEGDRLVGVVSLRDFVGAELAEMEQERDFEAAIAEGSTR